MLPRLPDEVWELVHHHCAAMVVQRRWRRFHRFAHARRSVWPEVRTGLRELWRPLVAYAHVRREWRAEPASWLDTSHAGVILREAHAGMWGERTLVV